MAACEGFCGRSEGSRWVLVASWVLGGFCVGWFWMGSGSRVGDRLLFVFGELGWVLRFFWLEPYSCGVLLFR